MLNFTYCNPTKIVFGRRTRFELGREAAAVGSSALLVSGSGSAVRSGYYAAALDSLKASGVKCVEMPGVSPNPLIEDCERAATLCRENGLKMLIAVGGGSVLDCCKAAAVGARNEGPIWDYFAGKRAVASALPVVSVMTVAATGSENDSISVVRNPTEGRKAGLMDPHLFPAVSILDPETTFTVTPRYTALGGFDIVSHVLEPYIDGQEYPEIQMRFIEALVSSTMENIVAAQADPGDFEARACLMWASALACCDILSVGTGGGTIAAHVIEGEVGGRYDTPHGAGLSAILPAVMEIRTSRYLKSTVRFAKNLMRLAQEPGEADEAFAARGIRAFREWIKSVGNPTALRELGVAESDLSALARQVNANSDMEYEEALAILRAAW